MKLLLGPRRIEWPHWIYPDSTLYDNLREEYNGEECRIPTDMIDASSEELFRSLLTAERAKPDNIEAKIDPAALDACERFGAYIGSLRFVRRVWEMRTFESIESRPLAISRVEEMARPIATRDMFLPMPPSEPTILVDPYDGWNIMSFVARDKPDDVFLLPGTDGLGGGRPLLQGSTAGAFVIDLDRASVDRNVRRVTGAVLHDPKIRHLWYDPRNPTKAGFVLAGGFALHAIQPPLPHGSKQRATAPYSDVDIFFIGSEEDAKKCLEELISFMHQHLVNTTHLSTDSGLFSANAITIREFFRIPKEQQEKDECATVDCQLITRVHRTLEDLLATFDMSVCKVAILYTADQELPHVRVAQDAARDLTTGVIQLDLFRDANHTHHARIMKYALKGFTFGTTVPVGIRGSGSYYGLEETLDNPNIWKEIMGEAVRSEMRTIDVETEREKHTVLRVIEHQIQQAYNRLEPSLLVPIGRKSRLGSILDALRILPRADRQVRQYFWRGAQGIMAAWIAFEQVAREWDITGSFEHIDTATELSHKKVRLDERLWWQYESHPWVSESVVQSITQRTESNVDDWIRRDGPTTSLRDELVSAVHRLVDLHTKFRSMDSDSEFDEAEHTL